jgi:hypothetical protein
MSFSINSIAFIAFRMNFSRPTPEYVRYAQVVPGTLLSLQGHTHGGLQVAEKLSSYTNIVGVLPGDIRAIASHDAQ